MTVMTKINAQLANMESRRRRQRQQQQHKFQWSTTSSEMRKVSTMAALSLFLVLACMTPGAFSEYENTWNFYYEQPCCGTTPPHNVASNSINGQVPHRFHRGRYADMY